MVVEDPRERKEQIDLAESQHQYEVTAQLATLRRYRSQNRGIHERYERDIKQNLANAFQNLQAVTGQVLDSADADWAGANLTLQKDLRSIRDEFQKARIAAEDALREISDKSQATIHEEEKIMLLSQKYTKYVKVLEIEVPTVQTWEDSSWGYHSAARVELSWWNEEVARRQRELENMGWLRKMLSNTTEMNRELELKQESEREAREEYIRTSWKHIYVRALRVREEEILASGRDRITFMGEAKKEAGEDGNALIDIKMALTDVCRDMTMLEACVRSPFIEFGRLDFVKCVLQLLESEHMAQVGQYTDIGTAKEGIKSSCQRKLDIREWGQVQRPFGYPFDDLDDIDDIDSVGVARVIEDVQDVPITPCQCDICLSVD